MQYFSVGKADSQSVSINDEESLLQKIAGGDREAYSQLYSHYTPKLYRFIYPFTNQCKEDAEEVLQDVFLKIWIKRKSLTSVGSIEAYLFRMAKNQLIDQHKRQKSRMEKDAAVVYMKEETGDCVYNQVVYMEYFTAAAEAVGNLSPQRKKIFELRTQQELSIDEISAQLQITPSAVKKQLYEAINLVKTYLHKYSGWPYLVYLLIIFCLG